MSNKQIIIDGVDVSGCMYHRMNNKMAMCKACNSGIGSPYCEYETNCYYKQLKRLEKKLEKIKEICKNVMPTGIDEETDKFGDILEIIEE